MKQLNIIFLILGSIIGAGFVSGKEIYTYFSCFGIYSLLFIIPIFFLFYFFIYFLFSFANKKQIDFFNIYIFKKKKIFSLIIFICFTIISSTMFAGLNSVFNFNLFSWQYILFNIFIVFICYIILQKGMNGLKKSNLIFVPLILITLILIIFLSPNKSTFMQPQKSLIFLPYSSVIYVCLNVFLSYYVIYTSATNISKKQAKLISFACSFILCLIIALTIVVQVKNPSICFYDIPFLQVAKDISPVFYYWFLTVICFAIISTLFSTLYSLKQFFNTKHKFVNNILPIVVSFFVSFIGFSNLVEYLYPVIGIIGLYVFIKLLFFEFSFQKSNANIHYRS